MRKISKRIISFLLTLVMILTTGMSGIATESAKAADSETTVDGHFGFELIGGTNNSIEVKTSLPTDTPCKDFLTTDNGCEIDQTSNEVANIGYVAMKKAEDYRIVFVLNLNATLTSGQQYKLPAKALFGFTDGKKYYLDADYTFTWNGSAWSMEKTNEAFITVDGTEKEVVARKALTAGYTHDNLVQFNNFHDFGLSADNTSLGFSGTVLLDGVRVKDPKFIGYKSSISTICLNGIKHKGKILTIKKDSVIYYGDKAVVITETFNQRSTGTTQQDGSISYTWERVAEIPAERDTSFTMTYRWADANVLQFDTTLPVSARPANNNVELRMTSDTDVTQQPTAKLLDAEGTLVLTLTFNKSFANGQCYTLSKGTKLVGADATYELQQDHICWWDGSAWKAYRSDDNGATIRVAGVDYKVVGKLALNEDRHIAYQTENLVQIGNFANLDVPANSTQLSFSGTVFVNGLEAKNFKLYGYTGEGSKTIAFTDLPHANKVLTIMAGSVIYYNGKAAVVEKAFHAKYDEKTNTWTNAPWTEDGNTPIISGDTNVNCKVDSKDLVCLKNAQKNNVTVTPSLDITGDNQLTDIDLRCLRRILVGDNEWGALVEQTKEYMLAENKFNGGGEYITFADRPADPTNPEKIEEYKAAGFNTATVTGEYTMHETAHPTEYYVLMTTEEAEVDTTGKTCLELTFRSAESNTEKKYIQVSTNITSLPGEKSHDFLLRDMKDQNGNVHDVKLEISEGAPSISWVGLSEGDGIVNLTFNYSELFKYQDTYTLKAGTTLNIDGTAYILDKTYKFQYTNDYRVSIDNLDKAGLNVWIRNASNKKDYFTTDIMDLLELYKDVIDGVYAGDEPFTTAEVKDASNKYVGKEDLMTFEDINSMTDMFNKNFADKYFFINQVGIYGYNHYEVAPKATPTLSAYATFFDSYNKEVLKNVESNKTPLCFDLYPLGYDTRTTKYKYFGSGLNLERKQTWSVDKWKETGISPYYLITMLTVANKAKEQGNIFSYYIQAKNNVSETDEHPVRQLDSEKKASKNEISMQLYAGMACGATMYGYYLYNALPTGSESGMIDAQGNQTLLYGYVQSANKEALPFADVLKTFTWEGAEFITGTSNKNSEALQLVTDSGLSLLLDNTTDGVLTSASATDDILVGYYKKDGQDAYMIANYNDPKQVESKNTVTLNFGDCNCARVYYGTANGLTSKIVELKDGTFEWTLQPGGGCFVIPVKAAS